MQPQMQSIAEDERVAADNEHRVLNLNSFSKHKRAQARKAFEALPPGASFEIIANHKPGQLFFELRQHYGFNFYWWPLERGPAQWRVMIAKPALGVQLTVASLMNADHQRLYQLWDELEAAVELCTRPLIQRGVAELSLGLRRYIEIEEALIFPLFEAQTGMSNAGPTVAMRSEHRQIERALDQFDKLRQKTDCGQILQSFERVVEPAELFKTHCRKEEADLYPLINMVFNSAEKKELLPVIQAFEI